VSGDGLHVALVDEEEMRGWVHGKQHWLFCFGRDASPLIDAVDQLIGVYPTFPTVQLPGFHMTVVPKDSLESARAAEIVAKASGLETSPTIADDQDIFVFSNDELEMFSIFSTLKRKPDGR